MRTLLTILFLAINSICFSQSDSISENRFYIPRNLRECITEMDKSFTIEARNKLKSLNKDTICYIYNIYLIDEWLNSDSSRLIKFFKKEGLNFTYEMEYFITLSYYKYLQTGNFDISKEFDNYIRTQDSIKTARKIECENTFGLDTINGQYIPKDLIDCYNQLDKMLCDSLKDEIRNAEDIFQYHFSLGLWIRNNYYLWGCSRLRKYFMNNEIRHPDNMSSIVLEGYRNYLKGKNLTIPEIVSCFPKIPPPTEAKSKVKFKPPKDKKRNKFLRTKKIEDFEISEYTSMK